VWVTPSEKIAVRDICMQFGTQLNAMVALSHISFDVAQRQFVSIVGESGCGKTTLLRIVAGLLPPSSGQVLIDGTPVDGPRLEVGFVFQRPVLLSWRSILDNVLLPVELSGGSKDAARAEAEDLLDRVGLGGFRQHRPRQLSGGMQQRAAIVRTLMLHPCILLMDEPFGALDAITREQMNLDLLDLWSERPTTVLFITHDIPEAVFLSDQVILMSPRPGQIAQTYSIDLPRPRTTEIRYSDCFVDKAREIRRGMEAGLQAGVVGGAGR
jgi:NitT/TauT family transport system ATP-binding protein